ARVCGARLRRLPLAGLRRGGAAQRARGLRDPTTPLRRPMSSHLSRIVVAAIGAPLVLGLVWIGGSWLFALVAVRRLFALHEYWLMVRPLRPLSLAGYGAMFASLVGAKLGGAEWMLGGYMLVFALAFVFQGIARTRAPATVAVSSTVLGAAWIGLGLGSIVLLRD